MTLKATRQRRLGTITATVASMMMIVVFAGLASAGSALADRAWGSEPPTLNGGWAPFNRCSVDDPAMLASDGLKMLAACLTESSPSGSVKLGNLSVATGASDHQFAFVLNQETEESEVIAPPGGVLRDESVQLPGGLRELMCPSSDYGARDVCRSHGWGWDNHSNAVTLTLESAGTPSNFNLFAGLFPGVPFSSTPVKLHLQNQLLGDDCYIGSDAEPIVLQLANLTAPAGAFELFDPDGTPDETGAILRLGFLNTSEGASSFAVPAASNCGHRGLFDQAIDSKVGLPSPAGGENSVVFDDASSYVMLLEASVVPNYGKVLSEDWHSAVLSSNHKPGHEHPGGGHRWSRHEAEEYFWHRFRYRH